MKGSPSLQPPPKKERRDFSAGPSDEEVNTQNYIYILDVQSDMHGSLLDRLQLYVYISSFSLSAFIFSLFFFLYIYTQIDRIHSSIEPSQTCTIETKQTNKGKVVRVRKQKNPSYFYFYFVLYRSVSRIRIKKKHTQHTHTHTPKQANEGKSWLLEAVQSLYIATVFSVIILTTTVGRLLYIQKGNKKKTSIRITHQFGLYIRHERLV